MDQHALEDAITIAVAPDDASTVSVFPVDALLEVEHGVAAARALDDTTSCLAIAVEVLATHDDIIAAARARAGSLADGLTDAAVVVHPARLVDLRGARVVVDLRDVRE